MLLLRHARSVLLWLSAGLLCRLQMIEGDTQHVEGLSRFAVNFLWKWQRVNVHPLPTKPIREEEDAWPY